MALRPLVGIFKGSHRFKLTPWKESGILKGSDDSKHSCGLSQPLHREHTRDSHTSWFSFTPAQFKHQLEMSNKNYYIRLFLFIRRFVFVCRVFLVGWLVGWVFVCLFVLEEGGISLLHLSGKVLTSTIMSATFSRPEITRLLTRTHKLSLHHALLWQVLSNSTCLYFWTKGKKS